MGAPYFAVRRFLDQHGVVAFSSNYALYADVSNRVMRTISTLVANIEVYSTNAGVTLLECPATWSNWAGIFRREFDSG